MKKNEALKTLEAYAVKVSKALDDGRKATLRLAYALVEVEESGIARFLLSKAERKATDDDGRTTAFASWSNGLGVTASQRSKSRKQVAMIRTLADAGYGKRKAEQLSQEALVALGATDDPKALIEQLEASSTSVTAPNIRKALKPSEQEPKQEQEQEQEPTSGNAGISKGDADADADVVSIEALFQAVTHALVDGDPIDYGKVEPSTTAFAKQAHDAIGSFLTNIAKVRKAS